MGQDRDAITIVRDDELGHICALRAAPGTAAIADPGADALNYTAGGQLASFASAKDFLGTLLGFVDTGVRAYEGGLPNLMSNKDILTAALNIHPAEARHSSHIRSLRRACTAFGPHTTDTTAPAGFTITAAAALEAFNEPLDAVTVKTITRDFRSAKGVTLGLFA